MGLTSNLFWTDRLLNTFFLDVAFYIKTQKGKRSNTEMNWRVVSLEC